MPVSSSSYSISCLLRLPFVVDQVQVRERPLRILVLALQVRVSRRAIQVEPVLLDVLAVVALAVVQAEHPLLEDRIGAIPQRQRQAQPLTLVTDPGDPVLTPPVSTRPRLLVREVVPSVSTLTVVLAHRRPLPLAQIRAPRLPRNRTGARVLQSLVLRGLGALRIRCHTRGVCTQRGGHATVPAPRASGTRTGVRPSLLSGSAAARHLNLCRRSACDRRSAPGTRSCLPRAAYI